MTARKYYLMVRPMAYILGCFSTKASLTISPKYAGTKGAENFIRYGYSMMIFPEGRRTNVRIPAHYGIVKILQSLQDDTGILLAKITWQDTIRVVAIDGKDVRNLEDPDKIMDQVYTADITG
jgi:1-acyl-sn-glycerol-3-phosphate acyltransferase